MVAAWIKRADGRGAFHRVGEPDIERKLGRFAKCAKHQAERNPIKRGLLKFAERRAIGQFQQAGMRSSALAEVADGSEGQEAEHDADAEAEVADAVDEEGFLGRFAGGGLFVVIADQEIGTKAHAFPSQIEHDEIAAHHQAGHHEDEQAEIGKEPKISGFALHIPGGEDGDEKADAADHAEHDHGERIEEKRRLRQEVSFGLALHYLRMVGCSGQRRVAGFHPVEQDFGVGESVGFSGGGGDRPFGHGR